MSNSVPGEWSSAELAKFCDVAGGGTPDRSVGEYWNGNIPWASPTEITSRTSKYISSTKESITQLGLEKSSAKLHPAGTVLMTSRASIGYVAINTVPMATNQGFQSLRCKEGVLADFIYQYITWIRPELEKMSAGSTFSEISSSSVKKLRTTLPPLLEQQKIAAILSSVDNVIEKTRAQIDKLKDLRTGMMQELLTKGVGHTEFKPLLNWRVGRISEIESVPASWELVDILSVAKLESGHTPSRDNEMYWGGDIPWLSLHDTKNLINPIINNTVYSVTQKGIDKSSARILPKGTVALSRTASVGSCVMLGRKMATSQDFANYICGEKLNPKYLLQLFRWMQHVWSNLSEGSTHQTIYMPVFKKLQILLPPYAEQIKIAEAAEKVDIAIADKNAKLGVVINLKKALMQDLLTGKVRVNVDQKEPAVA